MERKTLATWLVSAALGCLSLLLMVGTASAEEGNVVQGQNGSSGSESTSDSASARNDLTFGAGPRAGGNAPSQAAQNGDNAGSASQSSAAKSGDAVAGSQVSGVVGRNATVQNQNSSTDATATSGPVTATNIGSIQLGPDASAGDSLAQASQIGDNLADLNQSVVAVSGDAVSGSQVTGIAGNGDHTVQESNVAVDTFATSGAVDASNDATLVAGPGAISDIDEAQASQVGDNDATLTQSNRAQSGDAVAGSSVTGIVGDGSTTVQGQTSSTSADATSGDVTSDNLISGAAVGPTAFSGDETASASQIGDNSVDLSQDARAGSGDAVAGSQVTGLVADAAGHITVQNQQSSDDDTATSGNVGGLINSIDAVQAGPFAEATTDASSATQNGDNAIVVNQGAYLKSGDAVAGSQVTGVVSSSGDVTVQGQNVSDSSDATSGDVADGTIVNEVVDVTAGPSALAGPGGSTVSQVGDNLLAISQGAVATSGDAVAGSSVTGIDPHASVTVQNSNSSVDATASSGDVAEDGSINSVDTVFVGPSALNTGQGTEPATASQIGDNSAVIDQAAGLSSGDAVAGGQITGVIAAGSDVTVQNQNSSTGDTATSGDVGSDSTVNEVSIINAGPSAFGALGEVSATQIGDNDVSIEQSAVLASGDAVAGSQVTGVVASHGADVTVQNQNDSDSADAQSGDVASDSTTVNSVTVSNAGPLSVAAEGSSTTSQIGDNSLAVDQSADLSSGDAVAGAQVTGVVAAGGDVTIQEQNRSSDDVATSGSVGSDETVNDVTLVSAGPSALANLGESSSTQNGDNDVALSQSASVGTGDAVAGGQVTGVVGTGDATIQNSNQSEATTATSGDASGSVNDIDDVRAGPAADSSLGGATASQVGDNAIEINQAAAASSGDAVAGSQITGLVGSGRPVIVQNQNSADGSEATTGFAAASNDVDTVVVGPHATGTLGDASASQIGDDSLVLDQTASATSGDAVGGAQVVGAVGGESTIQLQNFDLGGSAISNDADAANVASGGVGPVSNGIASSSQQLGDSSVAANQWGDAQTGDAVSGGQVVGVAGFGASSLSTDSGLAPASSLPGDSSSFEVASAASS